MLAQLLVRQVVKDGTSYEIEALLFCPPKSVVGNKRYTEEEIDEIISREDRRVQGSTDERPLVILNHHIARGFKLIAFSETREGIYAVTRYIMKEPKKNS
ncbi:MAG: hypothetical protein PHP62_03505 [Candidatus Moranbacteria bacterium]|nr:hypothetical protein [Candidatus Moranbacteria bacterium]